MNFKSQVKIEVLFFDECPNAQAAIQLASKVASRFSSDIMVHQIKVDSLEKAKLVGFLGSPSIRVNGEDIEKIKTDQGFIGCRTYENGQGIPLEWMLEAALLRVLSPKGILFLCVANSARSQMAEGIARAMLSSQVKIWSAGSHPTKVRPEAILALKEKNIDISEHVSKSVREIPADEVEVVITLCAEEECPLFLGNAIRLHWGLPDPADMRLSESDRLSKFRSVRDELIRRMMMI